ncbi:CBS domain-containing protein [Marinobacter sp. NFXS9]|uniref:CBS domain-containing protein n=1 Tax=Marinobacter sp. NFXS9 TaxID=2818433 RepID=UPI0032DF0F96
MLVKDIMHKDIHCCSTSNSLDDIANQMWNEDVGFMPILDKDDKLAGVVTDRDIAMAAVLKHRPLWEISASEMVTGRPCHVCHPDDEVHKALNVMGASRIRRVPVIDGEQRLKGIIGLKDIADHTGSGGKSKNAGGLTSEELLGTIQRICKPNLLQASA